MNSGFRAVRELRASPSASPNVSPGTSPLPSPFSSPANSPTVSRKKKSSKKKSKRKSSKKKATGPCAHILNANEDDFNKKFAKFNKKKNAYKKKTKLNGFQFEWKQQFEQLRKSRAKVEGDLENEMDYMTSATRAKEKFSQQMGDQQFLERDLDKERNKFRQGLTIPLKRLRQNHKKLKIRLKKANSPKHLPPRPDSRSLLAGKTSHGEVDFTTEKQKVGTMLNGVKQHYQGVKQQLDEELATLTQELSHVSSAWLNALAQRVEIVEEEEEIPEDLDGIAVHDATVPLLSHYQKELEAIDLIYKIRCNSMEQENETAANEAAADGWTKDEIETFKRLFKDYAGKGKMRGKLIERSVLAFPHKTRMQIIAREEYHRKAKYNRSHKSNMTIQWKRDRVALIKEGKKAVEEADKEVEARYEQQERLYKLQQLQAERHKEVEANRLVKEARMLKEMEEAQRQLEEEMEEQRKKDEEWEIQRQKIKKKVKEHQIYRDARVRELIRNQEKQAQMEAAERAEQAVINKERVDYRKEMLELKEEENKLQKILEREEEYAKQMRLEAIRKQVVVEAKRDPKRVYQATASSSAEAMEGHQLFKVNGYDNSKISQDKRWRIAQALASAGLSETDYGRQVIRQTQSEMRYRPSMASNFSLGNVKE